MTEYTCKCGKKIRTSSTADVTGNRLEDYTLGHECWGCPYVVRRTKYAKSSYLKEQVFFECEAAKTIKTVTTTSGFYADKNNGYIRTLDFDFLRKVGDYCAGNDYLATPQYCFDHKSSYNANGDFTFTIMPTANKAGIAAKMALYEHFFNEHGTRKDTGGADETETIMAQIACSKAAARGGNVQMTEIETDGKDINVASMPEEITYQNFADIMGAEFISNAFGLTGTTAEAIAHECDYENWDGDDITTCICCSFNDCSDCPVGGNCTPVDSEVYILEYLVQQWNNRTKKTHDVAVLEPKPTAEKAEQSEATEEILAVKDSLTTEPDNRSTLVASPLDAVNAALAPAFDYSDFDQNTIKTLHAAENLIIDARRYYIAECANAVGIAHDALCGGVFAQCDNSKHGNRGDNTFFAWCESVGLKKDTAYRFLQVNALMKGATEVEQAILEQAPATLLYAAAKPSAPTELVEAVKSGDITTSAEYKKLLAEKQQLDDALTESTKNLLDKAREVYEADASALEAEEKAKKAKADFDVLSEVVQKKGKENARLQREAFEASEREQSLERKVRELEARPVEVAVQAPSAAAIERYRKEGEEKARTALKAQIDAADNARKKKDSQCKALQEQLSGKQDHLTAVEKQLAQKEEDVRLLNERLSAEQPRIAGVVYCSECIYRKQSRCYGLDTDSVLENQMECEDAEVLFCSYGKKG